MATPNPHSTNRKTDHNIDSVQIDLGNAELPNRERPTIVIIGNADTKVDRYRRFVAHETGNIFSQSGSSEVHRPSRNRYRSKH